MTRRMLAFLFSGTALAQTKKSKSKWFVTVPAFSNNCLPDAIEVIADSRFEALLNAGITVWSEAEWKDVENLVSRMKENRCVS